MAERFVCRDGKIVKSKWTTGHGTQCAAYGCDVYQAEGSRSFFTFPADQKRCDMWVQNIRRENLLGLTAQVIRKQNKRLCSVHFEDSQFMNAQARNKLMPCAVPTLVDVPNPPPMLASKRKAPASRSPLPPKVKKARLEPPEVEPDCLPDPPCVPSPVKAKMVDLQRSNDKLRKRLSRLRTPAKRLPSSKHQKQTAIEYVTRFLTGLSLQFFITQIHLSGNKSSNGNRYSDEVKLISLSLFNSSPKTYRLMRKLFQLPCVSTLKSYLCNIQFRPGFQDEILSALREKCVAMHDDARDCVLVFDEMAIKECLHYDVARDCVSGLEDFGVIGRTKHIANHASVFLVRGLFVGWKQPFGFFFSSGPVPAPTLKTLFLDAIDVLQKMGLRVRATVCDQGSNNRSMYKKLGVTPGNCAPLSRNGQNTFLFYDVPHLMKNIRNNMRKKGFPVGPHVVSWRYIEHFFDIDSALPVRLAPKLTKKHVYIPPFKSMSVKLATQVLSHSVAAGISVLCALGQMPKDAMHTSAFCERFDQLFNIFNSYSTKNSHKFKRAFSKKTSQKYSEFLLTTNDWLSSFAVSNYIACVPGWRHNILSLLEFWNSMDQEKTVLRTSKLNQDCLENFFSLIRGRGGNRENPDTVQFIAAYRALSVDFLFVKSTGTNCENDLDVFALKLKDLTDVVSKDKLKEAQCPSADSNDPPGDLLSVSNSPPIFSPCEDNILVYISGYVVKKVVKKFPCPPCLETLVSNSNSTNTLFLKTKLYDTECSLTSPSDPVVNFVSHLEKIFRNQVPSFHMNNIMQSFTNSVDSSGLSLDCCCPDHVTDISTYIVKLFFIIRINHYLREQNRELRETNRRKNRKMMKLLHN